MGLHGGDERLALCVLGQLGLQADQALEQLRDPGAGTPAVGHHPGEPVGTGDYAITGPAHGDVAVALQQAHESRDAIHGGLLLGGRDGTQHPTAGLLTVRPAPCGHGSQGGHQVERLRLGAVQERAHQAQVVLPHPRHAHELGTVGHLVEGQP